MKHMEVPVIPCRSILPLECHLAAGDVDQTILSLYVSTFPSPLPSPLLKVEKILLHCIWNHKTFAKFQSLAL